MKFFCEDCNLKFKPSSVWLAHLTSAEHQNNFIEHITENMTNTNGVVAFSLISQREPLEILEMISSFGGTIVNFYYDSNTNKTFIIQYGSEDDVEKAVSSYSTDFFDWKFQAFRLESLSPQDWIELFPTKQAEIRAATCQIVTIDDDGQDSSPKEETIS